MHALKLLKKEHAAVQTLFGKFERAGKAAHEKKNDLFLQIRRELQLHSKAEEEIFYPALKAFNGKGRNLVSEALKQHKDVDDLLHQIAAILRAAAETPRHLVEDSPVLIDQREEAFAACVHLRK